MQKREKTPGRVKGMRPVDWWRAGVWITRAAREQRVAKRLKRRDTIASKTEVSPPAKGKGKPR